MCRGTSDAHSRCIGSETMHKEVSKMYAAHDMVMAAEVAYRRERLIATRPHRKIRNRRRERAGVLQALTQRPHRLSAA